MMACGEITKNLFGGVLKDAIWRAGKQMLSE